MRQMMRRLMFLCVLSLFLCSVAGSTVLAKEAAAASPAIQPTESRSSAMLERASHGFSNIIYGPIEIPYQLKEEVKRTDPVRGLIPGVVRGVSWMCAREAVGFYELFTFYAHGGPKLKDFDTNWLFA